MNKTIGASLTIAVLGLSGISAQAQTATKDDAKALVVKAIAHVKKNGVEASCKDFADPQGGFMQGDLYVFVQDMQAHMICHAANPKMNGKDLSGLKDADGKQFAKAMADLVKSKGSGWVDYRWVNPVSKAIEAKTSYVARIDDATWLGVGIYKK